MNGPDMYELHEHEIGGGGEMRPATHRHTHSVHKGHPANWSNRQHEGVTVISWAEHGDRYRRQA